MKNKTEKDEQAPVDKQDPVPQNPNLEDETMNDDAEKDKSINDNGKKDERDDKIDLNDMKINLQPI